jgi:hypothetical protein
MIQRLAAAFCLLTMVAQSLAFPFAVWCRESDGQSRIELLCLGSATDPCCDAAQPADEGLCAVAELQGPSCAAPSEHCTDTPVVHASSVACGLDKAKIITSLTATPLAPQPTVLVLAPSLRHPVGACFEGVARPPDGLALIRCVILMV